MRFLKAAAVLSCVLGATSIAEASSHRDAPYTAEDQYADNTDVYAFIAPEDPSRVVLIANWVPLLEPASGPNFFMFSERVLYEIRVDSDSDAVPDISYELRFRTDRRTGATFLYNVGPVTAIDDADLNVRQFYTLTRRDLDTGTGTVVATDVQVAPWDVGRRSFPDYASVAAMAQRTVGTTTVFAGPRREAFQVDFNVFDLLGVGPRQTDIAPPLTPNYATRYNVMGVVLSVPITELAAGGVRPTDASPMGQQQIGVYATASRRQVTILRRRPGQPVTDLQGQWVQVSRLGLPLVNEVLIPLDDKDDYNRTNPADDGANFGMTILNPELNGLLRLVIPELGCIPTAAGGNPTLAAIVTTGGAPPSDLLRLNITAGQTFADSVFPNGRTLRDDVFTTEVNVICDGDGLGMGATPTVVLPPDVIGGPEAPQITDAFPYSPLPIRPN